MKKLWMIPIMALTFASSPVAAESLTLNNSYNPFEEMRQMQIEMDKIFARFHQRMVNEEMYKRFPATFPSSPAVDLEDKGDHYLLKADMPGAKKSEIDVSTKEGMLTIRAKSLREEEKQDKEKGYIKHERFEGVYVRSMSLPEDADPGKLESDYKDGVLKITIPKKKK